jgi:transposase
VAAVAGYLGMTTHSLYAWIKKFGSDFAEHNAMSDDQAEIRRLKKELNYHP